MGIHKSGECKFKDCDKPSIMEGYCSFHYQLINQQKNVQIMSQMVNLLSSMNDRLSQIESNLQISSVESKPYVDQNIDSNLTNNIKRRNESVGFIPSINTDISANVELKNLKTDQTKRDILQIANKLNSISGD